MANVCGVAWPGIILKLCIFVQDRWTLRKLTGHFHFLRARARSSSGPGALITPETLRPGLVRSAFKQRGGNAGRDFLPFMTPSSRNGHSRPPQQPTLSNDHDL